MAKKSMGGAFNGLSKIVNGAAKAGYRKYTFKKKRC
jgi:hypothetical protein